MGSGRFDADTWTDYAKTNSYDTKTREEIFTSRSMAPDLNPFGVKIRESRDSKDNPKSTAIIIAQDVTGSMGMISETMAKTGVPTLINEIYGRKPVSDPHVMCMAVGDADFDRAPLQVTQFEADIRVAHQLEKFWLEGGGGGNNYESYALAWYFAAMHTSIDCFEKRSKKGYLFTIGDEEPTPVLTRENIQKVCGTELQVKDLSMADLLTMVSRSYEVFHIIVEEGSHCRYHKDTVTQKWRNVLGQRALSLPDHTKLAEVIVSAIQIAEGASLDEVVDSWDGSTALVVKKATESLSLRKSEGGVVTL